MLGRKNKNTYAFIDSQNLNLGTQKNGWKMDWKKFRQFLADTYKVDKAFMFIGYVPEFEPMYQQLHDTGYMIVLKPTFDMTKPRPEAPPNDGKPRQKGAEEERTTKGNIDADLVLWAMKELPNYDKAVIISGDGDFYCLVEYLAAKKRLARLLTPNDHYSNLYNRYESYITSLDTLKGQLAYHDRPRRRGRNGK